MTLAVGSTHLPKSASGLLLMERAMATERKVTNGMFDSFSGPASELPPSKRTPSHVLAALRINPRVSTFDMSETPWLRGCIDSLKNSGHIVEDKDEPYPWHLFLVQPKEPQ